MIVKPLVIGAIMENTYILVSEETSECVIIDPGGEAERILEEVVSMGLTVKTILNTHGHGDHNGAVAAVKEATGATYAIHEKDLDLLNSGVQWLAQMMPDVRPPPEPDWYVKNDDIIQVGDVKLRVIETPGHTPGGVCYYGDGVLFTGDTLFQGSIGRFDMPGGDGPLLLQGILRRLMILPVDTKVYPGHGPESTIAREKLTNPFLIRGLV